MFTEINDCPRCGGSGHFGPRVVHAGICFKCNGVGKVKQTFKNSPEKRAENRDKAAARRAKKAAEAAAKAQADMVAFLESADHTLIDAFMDVATEKWASMFASDVLSQLRRNGTLSDAQVEAVVKAHVAWQKKAEEQANAQPVVEGNGVVITGTVIKLDEKFNKFGTRWVMTVKDDRGFAVWGTQPRGIDICRGDRVTFTANVEKSDKETFGFFKRPRKASVLPQDGQTD